MSAHSTEMVRVRTSSTIRHLGTRNQPLLRVVMLLAAAALLLFITFGLYPLTEEGTFFRELVVAGLGAVITVIAAVAAAWGPLSDLRRARREARAREKFDARTWELSAIELGRLSIPDIVVVHSAGKGREWTEDIELRFEDLSEPRPEPTIMTALREHRLPEEKAKAESRGVTFVDEPCVDLVGASTYFTTDDDGQRRYMLNLTPARATYFDFAITSAHLRAPLPPALGLEASNLDELWQATPRAIEHVANLPAMAKVGVSTVVVTSDNRLVLGLRGKTYIAGSDSGSDAKAPVHVVAEGMVPTDVDRRGRIDPAETAKRGMHEELRIGTDEAYGRVEELRAVGFFFDQLRWQPCFVYLARIDLTWSELQTVAPMASSYW